MKFTKFQVIQQVYGRLSLSRGHAVCKTLEVWGTWPNLTLPTSALSWIPCVMQSWIWLMKQDQMDCWMLLNPQLRSQILTGCILHVSKMPIPQVLHLRVISSSKTIWTQRTSGSIWGVPSCHQSTPKHLPETSIGEPLPLLYWRNQCRDTYLLCSPTGFHLVVLISFGTAFMQGCLLQFTQWEQNLTTTRCPASSKFTSRNIKMEKTSCNCCFPSKILIIH